MRTGRRTTQLGFSLLEVMVSVAILALALVATAGITASSVESSNYAKHLTVATMLARSKMIDVEEELRKDGFGDDEKEYDGDFSEEEFPKFKWVATVRPIEVDIGRLVENMFGADINSEEFPDHVQSYLGAFAGDAGIDPDLTEQVGDSQLSGLLGQGQLEGIFKQVGETLKQSIREIELVITWKDGAYEESVKFVQYVTTDGRLAMPQHMQLPAAAAGQPALPGHRNINTALPQPPPAGVRLNTTVNPVPSRGKP